MLKRRENVFRGGDVFRNILRVLFSTGSFEVTET